MSYARYDFEKLKQLAALAIHKNGISEEDSAMVADVLLGADLYGIESHGIQRLGLYINGMDIGRIKRDAVMKIVKETPVSAVIDAADGLAQPVSVKAMNMAIDKASKIGFGMVVVRNSNHFGSAGYYSMLAAKKGLMGMAMTNAEALVAPTFGKRGMMGTNPIAISMPAAPTVWHFDVSTSVVTAGKMEVYARSGKELPEGWAIDAAGNVNTRPETFLEIRKNKSTGGLLPLGGYGEKYGGHKGYGLSVWVELMTGIFSLGATAPDVRKVFNIEKCCHMFQAVDYGIFGDKAEIEERFSKYLRDIRASEKAEGCERIFTHGEKEREFERDILANGVPMHESTVREAIDICKKVGIEHEKYLEAVR